ncbi:VOC family protein [Reinekea sp.]|jgi:predicted enzyme related to lactoylglutathione lyase|uniref:VOC family protein n=1 Tax=Reinekea sp. TaxID=1970455 RepID=UPI002A7FF19F|nr:VOC family protein [Reinekea sp.]
MTRQQNPNLVLWLDLPVTNLDLAIAFYSAVLAQPLRDARPQSASATLQLSASGTGLTLIERAQSVAPAGAILPYFNCQGRLAQAVARAILHGGVVLQPIQSMEPFGQRAVIQDPDGHLMALHSAE